MPRTFYDRESWQIENAEIRFDPPPWKRVKGGRRKVLLTTGDGRILSGIKVSLPKDGFPRVEFPKTLKITNRPESDNPIIVITDRLRDTLGLRIREAWHREMKNR